MIKHQIDEWGRVLLPEESISDFLYSGHNIRSVVIDEALFRQFNEACLEKNLSQDVLITEPLENSLDYHKKRTHEWFMPDDYQDINVGEFLISLCKTPKEQHRVIEEMIEFEKRGLIPVLQLMIFLVNHFRENNVLYGVGRGSSVASFCLFLIGIHRINPMKYNLSIDEFLK